jgi:dTDP-4-amino-4,6-dideoxygalactose transaminase
MSPTAKLAMFGGERAVPRERSRVDWPLVEESDRAAMLRALDSGVLVSNAEGESEVSGLEQEFAEHAGVDHCIGVANGTVAITLALAALGIGAGDEVIVPALTFIGTPLGVVHAMATPVFADVDPDSFNMDPASAAAAISPRTKAIVVVHLHGLIAEMTELRELADSHGIALVEDAAQAHGARYEGRAAGSLADLGCFSLNATKNLPTCGEGGLVTTDDPELARGVAMRRQFGEDIDERRGRSYTAHVLGWNAKLNPIQAAFTRSQLQRLPDYDRRREENVERLLGRLGELPGITVPSCPPDRTHAFHILRFRFDPATAGLEDMDPGAFRQALHRVLRGEGVPVSRYQLAPLPEQEVFRDPDAPGPDPSSYVTATAVIEDSLTLQKRQLNPNAGALLDLYADGFEKVWENLDAVARIAGSAASRNADRQPTSVPEGAAG